MRRAQPILVLALTFTAVLALILGGTIAYLVLRPTPGSGGPTAGTETRVDTTVPSTDDGATTDPAASGSAAAEFCWINTSMTKTSTSPSGRIRGGGIETALPSSFLVSREAVLPLPAMDDLTIASSPVEGEENWVSVIAVGAVTWQPGFEYPGPEKAAQRMVDCISGSSAPWGTSVSKRHVENAKTEPVTIGGMQGYRSTATVVFDKSTLKTTNGSDLSAVVLDTPTGPALFYTEIPTGDAQLTEQMTTAMNSVVAV